MTALFGPAGNSDTFTKTISKSSLKAPAWLREIGLDVYEYQCGNGVHIGDPTALELGQQADANLITLSIHAPYYISLSNPDFLEKNIRYVLQSCKAAKAMRARRIVVHSGAIIGRTREAALLESTRTLERILAVMDEMGYCDIALCPETMGKINQLGDFDEVMQLCATDERLIPCIDFGHLYARSLGEVEGIEKTAKLFDQMENTLGVQRASRFHSHFSKIEYSKGGEKKHLTFANDVFGPDFRPIARLVAERGYAPVFICESAGTQSEDALEMKRIYFEELMCCD